MPGSNDRYQNILKELNLTEGSELYILGLLLLNLGKKEENQEQWDAALKYFCELTERNVHDKILDEYSS